MEKVTRGYGFLEKFLAKKRAQMADRLIENNLRHGRILDIGCGSYLLFLKKVKFKKKFGLDKIITLKKKLKNQDIDLKNWDIEKKEHLPFDDNYFEVITMLAIFEHLEPNKLISILKEIKRVLKKNGSFIMTTPAVWTDKILKIMAKFNLASRQEIKEHKNICSQKKIWYILGESGFDKKRIKMGCFEMGMNIWVKTKN